MAEEIDVGMKCIKYMLFISNFMFVMIGFLLISIGSAIKAIYGDFEMFMAGHYFAPSILAIVIGVTIFCVALFGCLGAIKESTCLINLFALFMGFLLVLEVSAAIASYAMRSDIEHNIRNLMTYSMQNFGEDPYDTKAWDFTQARLHCCGIDGPADWGRVLHVSLAFNSTEEHWAGPDSCCKHYASPCIIANVYRDGCLGELSYLVSESALLLGCGALAVAFIQLLGVIFALMLAKAVRRIKTDKLVEREQNRQRVYEQLAKEKEHSVAPVLYTPTYSEA